MKAVRLTEFPSEFEFMCLFVRLPPYLSLSASSLVTYPGGAWGIKLLWIRTHPAIHASAKHQHKIVNEYRSCCDLAMMVKLLDWNKTIWYMLEQHLLWAKTCMQEYLECNDLHDQGESNNVPPLNIYISSHPSLCLPLPDGTDSLTCLITPILAPPSLSFLSCELSNIFNSNASFKPTTLARSSQGIQLQFPVYSWYQTPWMKQ